MTAWIWYIACKAMKSNHFSQGKTEHFDVSGIRKMEQKFKLHLLVMTRAIAVLHGDRCQPSVGSTILVRSPKALQFDTDWGRCFSHFFGLERLLFFNDRRGSHSCVSA